MNRPGTLALDQLCRRLGVPGRHARYVLERRLAPPGLDAAPGRGHHHRLTADQATWMAIVLRLKAVGVAPELAAGVADFVAAAPTPRPGPGPHHPAAPDAGRPPARRPRAVELGDLSYLRLVHDDRPDGPDDWVPLERSWRPAAWKATNRKAAAARPVVILRVDLDALAALLRG